MESAPPPPPSEPAAAQQSTSSHELPPSNAPATPAPTLTQEQITKLFASVDEEYDEMLTAIQGEIPYPMQGTLYQIGPGRFDLNGVPFGHIYDGDGYVRAIVFENGRVHLRTRFVRTKKFRDETKAQQIVHRGFGSQPKLSWWQWVRSLPNIPSLDSNPANASIVYHGGKLLALWDGGHPYELNPITLDTIGLYNFGGELKPHQLFGSRYKLDPFTGDLFNVGLSRDGKPDIHLYQVDRTGKMVMNKTITCSRMPGILQDWILTDLCFCEGLFVLSLHCQCTTSSDLLGTIATNKPFYQQLNHNKELDSIYLIARRQDFMKIGEIRYDNEQCFGMRYSNGYALERETGYVMEFFSAHYPSTGVLDEMTPPFRGNACKAQLWRHELNLSKGHMERPATRVLASRFIDSFSWDPRRTTKLTRYYYSAASTEKGSKFMNAVQKFDSFTGEVWVHDFAPCAVSDPTFIPYAPTTQEEEGYVLVTLYDLQQDRVYLVFLDARAIDLPPVCAIIIPHRLPMHFQSQFVSELFI